MYRIFATLIEIAAASVFIVPIFFVYGKYIFHTWKITLFYIIFAFYLTAVLCLTGFPNLTSLHVDFSVNIVPLADIVSDFPNACLNVLLFIPLGFFMPLLWEKFRNRRSAVLAGFCTTCFIEAAQIFTFRTTDINDIITNVTGMLAGYLIIKRITADFTRFVLADTKSKDAGIVFGTVVVVMFCMQPFVSNLIWKMALGV